MTTASSSLDRSAERLELCVVLPIAVNCWARVCCRPSNRLEYPAGNCIVYSASVYLDRRDLLRTTGQDQQEQDRQK
jgi:hypothetical protein